MNHLFLVRAVRDSDVKGVCGLRDLAGPGFTSLAVIDAVLGERVRASSALFGRDIREPSDGQRYLLALEHRETGALMGIAGVKARVGDRPPFYNFRVLTIAQASAAANRRYDMDVLILVNEFTGCSEVGTLFVHPDARAGGVGRMLAQSRYLLMAAAPERFAPEVVSELRGVVDDAGASPFWEHLGRHFFKMDFAEADRLSASTDNQFILDLMPKYPIYVDLLPEPARRVIGQCHPHGEGAMRMLKWEGFRYEHVVDIFDAGPLVSAGRDSIRTFRESRRMPVQSTAALMSPRPALVAVPDVARFACVNADIDVHDGEAFLTGETLKVLGLEPGETALVWCGDAI